MKLVSPQLQAFLAVSKNKSVHSAAKALYITQTAVTQRIKNLEAKLGSSLFIRSRRGMQLTDEGEALLRYCQQIQPLEEETLTFIEGAGTIKNVSLTLCGPTTLMHTRIIPHCSPVLKKFPKLMMYFMINDDDNNLHLLRNGKCQILIIDIRFLSEELSYHLLRPEEYVMVATPTWRTRNLSDIIQQEKIIDFNPQDQMTFNYLKSFGYLGNANKDRYFVNRTELLASMIAQGLGYGILPLDFAKAYLKSKKLCLLNKGRTYAHEMAIAWFPRHERPAYFDAVIKACLI